jgi:hypothetical protein
MVRINIQNVEQIIFQNDEIWRDLPDLRYLREQWRLSRISPVLKAMGKKSILDFLNKAKKEHEIIVSKHLGTTITIDKLDYHVVQNIELPIENAELELNLIEAENPLYSYFGTYRTKDKIYITFWR